MLYLLMLMLAIMLLTIGPRVNLSDKVEMPPMDETLSTIDNYLSGQEQHYNLYSHANKKLVWFAGQQQTRLCIIYLHGFSATRTEIDPVPQIVAKALRANLFYIRYKGHGIKGGGDAYKGITVGDWYRDSLEAFLIAKLIGKKIIVMGHSTGATFATWLANRYPAIVSAQLYLSPNYYPQGRGVMAVTGPWGRLLLRLIKGEYNLFTDKEMIPKEGSEPVWSMVQHSDAVIAMLSAVKRIQKLQYEKMITPLFIACSVSDRVVRSSYTQKIFKRYGSLHKKLLLLDSSKSTFQHTITGDIRDATTNSIIADAMIKFIQKIEG